MKLAVCLRGHMRNMKGIDSINRLKEHHDVDVYIQTYSEIGTKSNNHAEISSKKGTVLLNSGFVDRDIIQQTFQPKKLYIEDYTDVEPILDDITEKYFYNWISRTQVYPNTVISQLRHICLSVEMLDDIKYDRIIISRPDMAFEISDINIPVESNSIIIPNTTRPPSRDADGGLWIDDTILLGDMASIKTMASLYHKLPDVMKDLEHRSLENIAICMHRVKSYGFENHLNLNILAVNWLYSRVVYG